MVGMNGITRQNYDGGEGGHHVSMILSTSKMPGDRVYYRSVKIASHTPLVLL